MKLSKRIFKSKPFQLFACWLAHKYIWLVKFTSRWQIEGKEHLDSLIKSEKPFIIAFWHGRLLMIPPFAPNKLDINVLISNHNDGELIARVMEHFNYTMIRGSTGKDAMKAFKNILRTIKRGSIVAITPDGPKGPRMRIGGNIIKIAQMTAVPVIPFTFSINNGRPLRSWDRFLLAKPFGKGVFVYGKPFEVKKQWNDEELKKAGLELENRLNNITKQADEIAGITPVEADSVIAS